MCDGGSDSLILEMLRCSAKECFWWLDKFSHPSNKLSWTDKMVHQWGSGNLGRCHCGVSTRRGFDSLLMHIFLMVWVLFWCFLSVVLLCSYSWVALSFVSMSMGGELLSREPMNFSPTFKINRELHLLAPLTNAQSALWWTSKLCDCSVMGASFTILNRFRRRAAQIGTLGKSLKVEWRRLL